ncbi:Dynamin family protein [Beauveria bassiana ARSEF 2860]|uniref:Dynamin family protein n=1 Tax=Beauveria bassiana (strain ARSEF 2860) TaxID=655819 RepID=J4VPT7_BEAB2|nr:Dynamin family protein [Beauveria bassiana ARSEF 2860]EJP60730.1 Dynamin family protein [Beauveria bassiana ARSEF 2860]
MATAKLQELCPEVQISLLDTVDSLRSHGLSSLIPLPQIIVCGDQSSGKSSVLESISGVPSPVHGSLCTRFSTELILWRTRSASIVISIVPHHARSEIMKAALHAFHAELTDFNELPSQIEQAKSAMDMQHAFSKDILRIEIRGPDRPHLTIVDLPGLIHSENKYQFASGISLIQRLVTRYMKQKRSIILAVVSAKNVYANQIVLKLARTADPDGMRTLGVITKPDTLNVGSESERSFLSLTRNQEVAFRLGWHVLRNRDTERELWTLDERDAEESNFLSSGAWTSLAPECRGSTSLRVRLSTVLVRQISRELPNLIREIEDLSIQCQESLEKLGMARTTSGEQKEYLIKISQSYQELIQNATAGTYTNPHFRESVTSDGYENRLRAVIQNRNRVFAKNMTERGQRYNIIADGGNGAEARNDVLTREQYIEKIVSMIRKNRGTELAGMLNPVIVTELFQELSSPWGEMAELHVRNVCKATYQCLKRLVDHIADSAAAETIFSGIFKPHLDALQQNSLAKLSELLKPHQESHPITYDQRFIKDRETVLNQREEVRVTALLKETFGTIYMDGETSVRASIDFSKLVQKLVKRPEFDVDHSAATDALDCLLAYYQTALSRFIDDVTVKVIETCVVGKLREIMDPMSIFKLDDDSISRFAGETEKCRTTREELKAKQKALQNGSNVCNKLAAPFVHALYAETDSDGGVDQDDEFLSDTGSEDFVSKGEIPPYKMKNGHRSPSTAPEEPTKEKVDDEWERLTTSRSKNDKKKMKKKALLLGGV